ncbi:sugar ABC transporter permease [Ponticoccus sp. SC2-23]|uniref:carbohydrate ABC transporter permease n=1 Tax=Alexandriicola marinus TaxID=2081710 RepID=UPI000FD728FB|nr:sugar ABC transporter permease [Alexandriicola marinus]MBM1219762.1 sugar ABC transporter permease [Ponticoccus sp. SC6-9]MBM1223166.1 sugar ABC transporter permease [Ponticoccus sp. SC6-15]MBM1229575.1 sugar ABC transporter permease [Ponticoccus sp. SC6-38]MBM1232132.1 sugar ABC transporter permease [Ponticoccus sp. SC6-45]MBM1237918.1 sugar ABC transporter permease [Ponticoccus sp. SC6-49]MBM1241143.1 sugar ABC transporter permease [Ponticoccus sp. SC2-64]MBM1245656.1 sugar ABC transpor
MPHKTFLSFIWPSLVAMLLFIALPIVSVGFQSLYVEHEQVLVVGETCGPFGCTEEVSVDAAAMAALRAEQPAGQFNGLGTYTNASHLATDEIAEIFATSENFSEIRNRIMNLPFYKALIFTLSYTFIVTPLVIILGFIIAVAVNAVPAMLKGPVIFFSLIPMLVTPLVGSLVLFWMIDSRGIIGAALQSIFGDPSLSLKASPTLTWITLFVYGVWHSAPFAFVVFYAGLQTVPRDTMESAMVDGANRWERIRFVTIPYLMPLATFIALMQLMDNFRVFEPIIGFSAAASATSLSYLIYNDLRAAESPLFGSAAATSMLTIIGVIILLLPVLRQNWREFNRKT